MQNWWNFGTWRWSELNSQQTIRNFPLTLKIFISFTRFIFLSYLTATAKQYFPCFKWGMFDTPISDRKTLQ